MLPKAIRNHLLGDPQIVAIVGQRVHYKGLPEFSEFPHIWIQKMGRQEEDTLDGDGFVYHRFTVEIAAEKSTGKPDGDGERLSDLVFERLHQHSGPFDGTEIDTAYMEDVDDNYVYKSVDSDDRIFVKAFDLMVIT